MVRVEDGGRGDAGGQPPRLRRMRARRLRIGELRLEEVRARFRHRLLGELEGLVEDVSMHGMAVVVAGGVRCRDLVIVGDRVDDL